MTEPETKPRSTLAALRDQVPARPLTAGEARQVLERQSTRLLRLSETYGPPVPVEAIATALPRPRQADPRPAIVRPVAVEWQCLGAAGRRRRV